MLKFPLKFGKDKSILVCETDGFIMRGAVFTRAGKELVTLFQAQSQQANMGDAVADLIKQLKAAGWEGGEAVLLSPSVLSVLIELPIQPKKPRPLAQMQELVKWEAEPLYIQHMTQWSVGHLLVGRGYMTEEQAQAVLDLQQGNPSLAGGLEQSDKFALRRFGELAEELGYIRSSQLKACLAGQEWLKSDDENIECGWLGQGEVSDVPGTYNWLVSCTNQSLLKRWIKTFNTQGVNLQAMYPLTGCSAALLGKTVESAIIMESHADMALAQHRVEGELLSQHLYVNPAKEPLQLCLESYHALNPSSSEPVYLADWQDTSQYLQAELKATLDVEINVLDQKPISESVSPGMLGAGLHALGLVENKFSEVRLGGPLPAFWQRVEVRAAALFLVLFVLIAGSELSLFIRDHAIQSRKAEVDAQWQVMSRAIKNVNADIKQVEKRKEALKEQERNYRRAEARVKFFGDEVPERVALVQAILGILQDTVSDEVIITSIDEYGKRVAVMPALPAIKKDPRIEVENFNLLAWAVSETAGQTFIQKVAETIEPWGLEVRDSKVLQRPGPMNIEGFAVSMRLVKLVSAESIKEQQAL